MKLSSDEIIKWADDAGVNVINRTSYAPVFGHITEIHLIRIAKLAYQAGANAEREECAKLCDFLRYIHKEGFVRRLAENTDLADAIRSRGDK